MNSPNASANYSYTERKLLPFLEDHVDPKNGRLIKNLENSRNELESFFGKNEGKDFWKDVSPKSGHADFSSRIIASVHVGYSRHGNPPIVYGDHLESVVNGVKEVAKTVLTNVSEESKEKPEQHQNSINRYNSLYKEDMISNEKETQNSIENVSSRNNKKQSSDAYYKNLLENMNNNDKNSESDNDSENTNNINN